MTAPALPSPRRRSSRAEIAAWVVVAAAVGGLLSWLDMPAREFESGLLIFMLAGFWVALPGRAPVTWLAIACGMGPVLAHYLTAQIQIARNPTLPSVLAVFAGAFAGRLAGRRLELSPRAETSIAGDAPWFLRSFDARTLLALALSALVSLSLVPVFRTVTRADFQPGLAEVRHWQIFTFIAWVLVARNVVSIRGTIERWLTAKGRAERGLTPLAAAAHLGVVGLLTLAHAAAIALILRVSPIVRPEAADAAFSHVPRIFAAYLPFDLFAYAAILGLAFLVDTERQSRESRQRAAALQADALASRLSAVRARLNPHFLYNALNAAVMLARSGQGAETSRVLEDVTGLLRYVLDDSADTVPLARELEFVRRYVEIQQVRFGEMLSFTIDASPTALSAPVPPLVLQPLVENAVEHGMAAGADVCTIRVSAAVSDGFLVMQVDDEGDGTRNEARTGNGIGLGHTRERLHALYGPDATVTLESIAPRGMRAEVRVPQ